MSVNLLQIVTSRLRDHASIIPKIVDADGPAIAAAEDYALSAIVGGLIRKVQSGDGADEVFVLLDDFDDSLVEQIGGLLQGGDHADLLLRGTSVLSAIFGERQAGLLELLSRVSGIDASKIGTLMGLLSPLVMSVLGQQRRASSLDSSGVANLLGSQSDYLSLPNECATYLGLDDSKHVEHVMDDAVAVESNQVPSSAGVPPLQQPAAQSSKGMMMKTFLPLAILGILVFAAFTTFFNGTGGGTTGSQSGITVPDIALPGFDGKSMADAFGAVAEAVAAVRDEETAIQAVKTIEAATAVFDEYDLDAIASTDQKNAVGAFFDAGISRITSSLDKAYRNAEAKDVVQPALDRFLDRFRLFAG